MNKKLSKSLHTWNSPAWPYLHPNFIKFFGLLWSSFGHL